MTEPLHQIAHAFRRGHDTEANELFAEFIGNLANLLSQQSELPAEFNMLLEIMLNAQMQGDYLWLADIIEFELAPLGLG